MGSNKNFGTTADALSNAARVRPPMNGEYFDESLTADTAAGPFATGVATYGPGQYAFGCGAAFMIVFGTSSSITNPPNNEAFPAGVHHFYVTSAMTHFEITATENSVVTWWKSSYGNE